MGINAKLGNNIRNCWLAAGHVIENTLYIQAISLPPSIPDIVWASPWVSRSSAIHVFLLYSDGFFSHNTIISFHDL